MFKVHINKENIHYKFIIRQYFYNHFYMQEKRKKIK